MPNEVNRFSNNIGNISIYEADKISSCLSNNSDLKTDFDGQDNTTDESCPKRESYRPSMTESQMAHRKTYQLRSDSPSVNRDHRCNIEPNDDPLNVRSRKRARNEMRYMGQTDKLVSNPLLGSDYTDDDTDADDERLNHKMSSRSDMEDDRFRGDSRMFRGRNRQMNNNRTRDSSLGSYLQNGLYGGGGTMPRRQRHAGSLTRATTIGGVDPHGTLRSACRLAQSIRTGVIPPPPTEPPPATPLSGSIMSDFGSLGNQGLFNSFVLQQQQQQQAGNFAAAVAAVGGIPPYLANQNGLANGQQYMLNPALMNTDMTQLLQLQQQQQQQRQASFIAQQQQQQLLTANLLQHLSNTSPNAPYMQHFSTYGRVPPYLNPTNLLAAAAVQQQQQQQQPTVSSANYNNLHMSFIHSPSANDQTGGQNESDLNNKSPATTTDGNDTSNGGANNQSSNGGIQRDGSNSVVYENSYNSFNQCLLKENMAPSMSTNQCAPLTHNQSYLTTSQTAADGICLGLNGAGSNSLMMMNGATLGREHPNPLIQTLFGRSAANNTNPNFIDPTYLTSSRLVNSMQNVPLVDHEQQQQQQQQQQRSDSVTATVRSKRPQYKCYCPWYYWVIVILVFAFSLALMLAITFSEEKERLDYRLQERLTHDPAIIGIFDPNNPPYLLHPNQPVQFELDSMGSWSAQWQMPNARYIQYNITVTSHVSSVGVFMRHNTMPTIIHYDVFDRISGQILQSKSSELGNRVKRAASESGVNTYELQTALSSDDVLVTGRLHYLEEGTWFILLVNDQPRKEPVQFVIGNAVMDSGCPNLCSNRGVCDQGVCDCVNGFKGPDCSLAQLPKVCNGHGDYLAGACKCYPEWKGRECETLWSDCADMTCSGNGRCVIGDCQCYQGYSGSVCEIRNCIVPNCSDHGICLDGTCRCFHGWTGIGCELSATPTELIGARNTHLAFQSNKIRPSTVDLLLADDSRHDAVCPLDCGEHGLCQRTNKILSNLHNDSFIYECRCNSGWSGENCQIKECDPRCLEHGRCMDGICVCQIGWNGKFCTLDGCPHKCNADHGHCIEHKLGFDMLTTKIEHRCQCEPMWDGTACQREQELACDDGVDNDDDGLTDCSDPDCCPSVHCQQLVRSNSKSVQFEIALESCAHSEPFDHHLLITPLAQPGTAFYSQLEFLLRRDRIVVKNFDPRRISVVRGVVRQWDGSVLWGCRVSDPANVQNGFTLTDKYGRFDLPVDGGTVVQLEFLRYPTQQFSAVHHLYVPINQIVYMGDFYVFDSKQLSPIRQHVKQTISTLFGDVTWDWGGTLSPSPIKHDLWSPLYLPSNDTLGKGFDWTMKSLCVQMHVHDPVRIGFNYPLVYTDRALDFGQFGTNYPTVCLDQTNVFCVRNGALIYTLPLKNTNLKLIYRSDCFIGYKSAIRVDILDKNRPMPFNLKEIHLVIDIAGFRYTELMEPEPGLTKIYYWNKTDGYNRSVYGLVGAKVSVGFVYKQCLRVFWEHRMVYVHGNELTTSDMANWNLNVLYTYAINQGIIYRGDGSHQYLKLTDWFVSRLVGLSHKRRTANDCGQCSTAFKPFESPLYRPIDVIVDATGNVILGDGGFLRWLNSSKPNADYRVVQLDSGSLNTPLQESLKHTDRLRLWDFADDYFKLDFGGAFDERSLDRYYLAVHPHFQIPIKNDRITLGSMPDSHFSTGLFLSHPQSKSIWWIKFYPIIAAYRFIGSACSQRRESFADMICIQHTLDMPKAMAVTQKHLYFIDRQTIWSRSLDLAQLREPELSLFAISLVIGQANVTSRLWNSIVPCERSMLSNQIRLDDPDHLVYNPVEQVLYFADQTVVYRYHISSQVISLAVGRLKHCPITNQPSNMAHEIDLDTVRGLAVSPEGDLYIAQSNQVLIKRSNGRIYSMAGKLQPKDNKDDRSNQDGSLILASEFEFQNITSIAVSLFGELFIADNVLNTVYRVHYKLPDKSNPFNMYRILNTMTDELDSFGSYGQLVKTDDIVTQMTLHHMDYRISALSGWLSHIRRDEYTNKLTIHRDTQGNLVRLETPSGLLYNITMTHDSPQYIRTITDPMSNGAWNFYYSPNGLLIRLETSVQGPSSMGTNRIDFVYHAMSGRLTHIQLNNGIEIDVNAMTQQVDSKVQLADKGNKRLVKVSNQQIGLPNDQHFEVVYGDSVNPWKMSLSQLYFVRPDLYRPLQMKREIVIPPRTDRKAIEHVTTWLYDVSTYDALKSLSIFDTPSHLVKRDLRNHGGRYISRYPRQSDLYLDFPFRPSQFQIAANDVANGKNKKADHIDWQYRKTLQVNGQKLLYVKFNSALQLETYERILTEGHHVALQIVYNAQLQPIMFNASMKLESVDNSRLFMMEAALKHELPAPLTIMYTNIGHVSEFHWGSASYRFTYDSSNRLKAAELGGPLDTISFQYDNDNIPYQPTMVSVSGLGPFTLLYSNSPLHSAEFDSKHPLSNSDKYLGLSAIITPSGFKRQFFLIQGLQVHRLIFHPWPDSPGPWIYEWTGRTQLSRFEWPSAVKRITFMPQSNLIVYDKVAIRWNDVDGLVDPPHVRMTDLASGFELVYERLYQGPLLSSWFVGYRLPGVRNAHPALGGLLNAKFSYTHDANMNLFKIHTQLYAMTNRPPTSAAISTNLSDWHLATHKLLVLDEETLTKIDSQTGRVLSIREFDLTYRGSALWITHASKNVQFVKQWDSQGRITQTLLYLFNSKREPLYNLSTLYRPNTLQPMGQREEREGHVPRWITFVHGPGGRLEALDREEAGTSLRSHCQLIHNPEGRIARLRIATSDPQLNVKSSISHRSEELQFIYDSRGFLSRRGNWNYEFDEDGFLTRRYLYNDMLNDQFGYNSKGLLIWAVRTVSSSISKDDEQGSTTSEALEDDVGLKQSYSVQFVYDSQDRLIVIRNTMVIRDLVQLFYADPDHPQRITHLFNHGRLKSYRFLYEPVRGHLFAIEQFDHPLIGVDLVNADRIGSRSDQIFGQSIQKRIFFVVTNHEASPTSAFSENGKLVWSAQYSATGSRRLHLPNRHTYFAAQTFLDELDLPLGIAGCLTDVHTGFVFCPPSWRAYDPLGATFTSPDWRGLMQTRLDNVRRDPSVLDTHKWGTVEHEYLRIGPFGLFASLCDAVQSPTLWLSKVGLELDKFGAQQFDLNRGSLTGRRRTSFQSNWELDRLNSKFGRLNMIRSDQTTFDTSGVCRFFINHESDVGLDNLLPANTMFGLKVSFNVDSHNLVSIRPSNRDQTLAGVELFASTVLSQSRLVDWWTHRLNPADSSSPVHLLIQLFVANPRQSVSHTVQQLSAMNLKPPSYDRQTDINLTLHPFGNYTELWLTKSTLQWRIRFYSTIFIQQSDDDMLLKEIELRGHSRAWKDESQLVRKFGMKKAKWTSKYVYGLNYPWTTVQLDELQRSGRVEGFDLVRTIDLEKNNRGWHDMRRLYDHASIYQIRPQRVMKSKAG